ncbi:NnrU family protein [Rhizobiaceae bacterium BDR2-2]|uniref:NnrU family protein n=1 Tax=Ectorhizobium quercum TaxID=2965071 RepID=A0AAE3MY70_9HYPH|nr:NnrU family protein [Ectorhizobium quercum]MCX8996636.1 NnrU family protein [Ectorhizobium quercum]
MILLVVGLLLFLCLHSARVVAPQARSGIIARIGEGGWKGLYSLLSLGFLVLVIYGFAVARADTPVLWYPPVWTQHIALVLMLPAMICLAASFLPAGHIKARAKFPLVLSVKIWALAHLIANGELSSILLFATFLAWGVVLRISLKRRAAEGEVTLPVFVSGRYDAIAVVAGLALWGWMILGLHEWLIGVAPLVF